jgi:thiol-disulfide isomerase/thioredoxin
MENTIVYLEDQDFTPEGKLLVDVPVICLIYASYCPPCIEFKPIYYELPSKINGIIVSCIETDGHLPGQKELMARMNTIFPGLQGTPTVVMFNRGYVEAVYDGDRTLESLLKFCKPYGKQRRPLNKARKY